jgi:hypothetical protein
MIGVNKRKTFHLPRSRRWSKLSRLDSPLKLDQTIPTVPAKGNRLLVRVLGLEISSKLILRKTVKMKAY